VQLHTEQVEKGRPFLAMRINGRSLSQSQSQSQIEIGGGWRCTIVFTGCHTVAADASFTSPLFTVNEHPLIV